MMQIRYIDFVAQALLLPRLLVSGRQLKPDITPQTLVLLGQCAR